MSTRRAFVVIRHDHTDREWDIIGVCSSAVAAKALVDEQDPELDPYEDIEYEVQPHHLISVQKKRAT